MNIAYLGHLHTGGTYTVFLLLRQGLARYGHDVRCLCMDSNSATGRTDRDHQTGLDVLVPSSEDPRQQTVEMVEHVLKSRYDLVVFNPGCGQVPTNAARFLPERVRRIAIVHTMTRGAYAPASVIAPFVDQIVAVSDRISQDLIERWGVEPRRVCTIFHGVDVSRFSGPRHEREAGAPLRLLFVGRINDYDKGVMQIPPILAAALKTVPTLSLDVVGNGPDESRLRDALERRGIGASVRFVGRVPYEEISRQVLSHDLFLMPSRWEGCGTALQETMAGGCVPVATRIEGSIASIIEDGTSGFLCLPGDIRGFAGRIVALAQDRELWGRMSSAARQRITQRFTLDQMCESYARLLERVMTGGGAKIKPLPMTEFSVHPQLLPTWRTRIPQPVKNFARKWAERLGRSV